MPSDNIYYLEQEFEIGDYVLIKDAKTNPRAIIIDKRELKEDMQGRKFKYVVVDIGYNKRTYYADQMIKLEKTEKKYTSNVVNFKR